MQVGSSVDDESTISAGDIGAVFTATPALGMLGHLVTTHRAESPEHQESVCPKARGRSEVARRAHLWTVRGT